MEANEPFFQQRKNDTSYLGFIPFLMVTATLQMISYSIPADELDGNLRMAKVITIKCMKVFIKTVVGCMERLLAIPEVKAWPGMLGSVDCMHLTARIAQ